MPTIFILSDIFKHFNSIYEFSEIIQNWRVQNPDKKILRLPFSFLVRQSIFIHYICSKTPASFCIISSTSDSVITRGGRSRMTFVPAVIKISPCFNASAQMSAAFFVVTMPCISPMPRRLVKTSYFCIISSSFCSR